MPNVTAISCRFAPWIWEEFRFIYFNDSVMSLGHTDQSEERGCYEPKLIKGSSLRRGMYSLQCSERGDKCCEEKKNHTSHQCLK